ncbi:MAG: hypothetical protein BGO14_08750 [Chlamydiales bacterium 38-26]|nr:response regulator transcription factor [Chlamydiales bacterium]OJV11073.1 MAG: hypothetical protein BGO14_08750 [Chlamydiales bacterium 38-26]
MGVGEDLKLQKRNTIVIVDDDLDLLKLLLSAYEAEGFDVKGFSNGKEAIAYLDLDSNIQTTRLLILDRLLPDMDGLDILRQFSQKLKAHTPVLILSVLSGERDVLSGLKEGAVDYIEKPFNLTILMEKTTALMNRFNA